MKPVNFSSASVNQKQFWIEIRLDVSRKQGPTHIGPDLDPNGLILKVFLIFFCYFSEKGHFQFRNFIYLEMLMEDGLDPYWPFTLPT